MTKHGKKYVERNTVVHFKKTGMLPIAKFIESVEASGYPTRVTRLNIRIRYATQLGPTPARSLAVVSLNRSFMGFVVYATLGHVKGASPPAPLRDQL